MADTGMIPEDRNVAPPDLHTYAAEAITQRLERMLSHLEGVRKGDEKEPVHQMRVWSRRTRAALEVFAACFHGREFASVEREVKAAADALGEARDLDVMIESLSKRAEALPPAQRTGLDSFVHRLKAERASRQAAVTKAIERLERQDLKPRFARLSAETSSSTLPNPHAAGRKGASHG